MPPSAAAFARSFAMMFPRDLLLLSRHPIRSCQRHPCHCGGLDGECSEVLGLEIEQMRLAAGARKRLRLKRQHGQIIAHPTRARLDDEALLQRWVLRRDADRTAPGMAVVAITRCCAKSAIFILVDRPVAIEGDERGGADRDSIGTHRECLGNIGARADAARDDELHLAVHVELQKCLDSLPECRQGGDSGMFYEYILGGTRAALHTVEHDHISPRLD